jgi:hypothetical protein
LSEAQLHLKAAKGFPNLLETLLIHLILLLIPAKLYVTLTTNLTLLKKLYVELNLVDNAGNQLLLLLLLLKNKEGCIRLVDFNR